MTDNSCHLSLFVILDWIGFGGYIGCLKIRNWLDLGSNLIGKSGCNENDVSSFTHYSLR